MKISAAIEPWLFRSRATLLGCAGLDVSQSQVLDSWGWQLEGDSRIKGLVRIATAASARKLWERSGSTAPPLSRLWATGWRSSGRSSECIGSSGTVPKDMRTTSGVRRRSPSMDWFWAARWGALLEEAPLLWKSSCCAEPLAA